MIKILTIEDLDFANRVMKDSEIYPFISDDFSPDKEDFSVELLIQTDGIYVFSASENSVIIMVPVNGITYDVHVNFTKKDRGQKAVDACMDGFEFAFNETPAKKLICWIPETCLNVLHFAEKMGMVQEGLITKSFQKDGKLYDQYILGITREEWKIWLQQR